MKDDEFRKPKIPNGAGEHLDIFVVVETWGNLEVIKAREVISIRDAGEEG